MSLRSGKLPSLGSEDEFFDHKGYPPFSTAIRTAVHKIGDARNGFPFLGGARNPVTIVTDLREK